MNKFSRKATASLLTLFLALSVFTGCSGDETEDNTENLGDEIVDIEGTDTPDDADLTDEMLPDEDGTEISDVSVADDLENYMNVEMAEINESFNTISDEISAWDTDDVEGIIANISDVLLPIIEDSLDKIEEVSPATEEVQNLKDMYEDVLLAYGDGFASIIEAYENDDEAAMDEALTKTSDALDLVGEYNAALEELAEANGMTVEY